MTSWHVITLFPPSHKMTQVSFLWAGNNQVLFPGRVCVLFLDSPVSFCKPAFREQLRSLGHQHCTDCKNCITYKHLHVSTATAFFSQAWKNEIYMNGEFWSFWRVAKKHLISLFTKKSVMLMCIYSFLKRTVQVACCCNPLLMYIYFPNLTAS